MGFLLSLLFFYIPIYLVMGIVFFHFVDTRIYAFYFLDFLLVNYISFIFIAKEV